MWPNLVRRLLVYQLIRDWFWRWTYHLAYGLLTILAIVGFGFSTNFWASVIWVVGISVNFGLLLYVCGCKGPRDYDKL
jgi:hypothetical protein